MVFSKRFSVGLCALLLAFTAAAWAGMVTNNRDGDLNGRYEAKVKFNKTKEVVEDVPALLEGYFLTLDFETGKKTYKVSDFYDKRYALEADCFDRERGEYMTVELVDMSPKLWNNRDSQAKKKAKKTEVQQTNQTDKTKKTKKRKKSKKSPLPSPSPSPEASPNVTDNHGNGGATTDSPENVSVEAKD